MTDPTDRIIRPPWTPEQVAAPTGQTADEAAELDRLRTENTRMRHELEVMYGGAFDTLEAAPATPAAPAPAAGRAAVLLEAADELGRMDYDTDSNDYGYDTYRDAWNGGVMDGAALLRRLAGEAQQDEGEPGCPHCGGDHAWDDCEEYTALVAREARQAPTQDGPAPVGGVKGNPFDYHPEDDAAAARSGQSETDPEVAT